MNARLKLLGYLLSELGILLLAVSAWLGAGENVTLRIMVASGASLASAGMAMRWIAYWRKQRNKRQTLP